MKAESVNRNTGEFTIRVNPQAKVLSAGMAIDSRTGEEVEHQWLPCDQCHTLHRVPLNVVSFVCSDECKEAAAANAKGPSGIPGYSHACGYHD